ncbi:hypothetical protein R70211_00150 [Paraburkholderia domus]|uniref:Uncharacterized protein n=1 Tax=Paraburkholderia domus TaxID=2793075 RepID=A0A9N8MK69_9BURK|nr:hypothetical protein R70211_00150 [Paraburkholderia domus]
MLVTPPMSRTLSISQLGSKADKGDRGRVEMHQFFCRAPRHVPPRIAVVGEHYMHLLGIPPGASKPAGQAKRAGGEGTAIFYR